jgi:Fur family ferric uptake transcriptional regulator
VAQSKPQNEEVETFLRASGLRRTPVRVGVIEVLTKSGRPLPVTQILSKLRGVDSVTVYRTLGTFEKKGIVHKVRSDDRSWLYAIGSPTHKPEHKHPHFVCDDCGKVQCLESAVIPEDFVRSLGVEKGFAVTYSEVVLHGSCPSCK